MQGTPDFMDIYVGIPNLNLNPRCKLKARTFGKYFRKTEIKK